MCAAGRLTGKAVPFLPVQCAQSGCYLVPAEKAGVFFVFAIVQDGDLHAVHGRRKIRRLPGHKRDGIGVSGEQFGQAQRDMPGVIAIAHP